MSSQVVYRYTLGLGCLVGLLAMYIFQDSGMVTDYLPSDPHIRFIVSKSLRYLINDALSIGLIYSIFRARIYLIMALGIQLFGTVFLLTPYFVLKLYLNLGNGPLVSFLHRIVINPVLMLLLIPAFLLVKKSQIGKGSE